MPNLDCIVEPSPKFSQSSQPQSPTPTTIHSQPLDTLTSVYMVCGLPKNPQCWTLAQLDYVPAHLPGAVPRFWRPEVLGTTVSGQDILSTSTSLASHLEPNVRSRISSRAHSYASTSSRTPKIRSPKLGTLNEPTINKEEISRIQAKTIKLAFPREVEIIASKFQPPSNTHCFSFTVPSSSTILDQPTPNPIGQQWELVPNLIATVPNEKTYFAACLQVWSHSDKVRSEAVKKTLEEISSKSKSMAISRAIQAAAAGRKFGSKLQKALNSPMGLLSLSNNESGSELHNLPSPGRRTSMASSVHHPGKPFNASQSNCLIDGSASLEVDETEGLFSESEWETSAQPPNRESIPSRLLNNHHDLIDDLSIINSTPLWLPHCLILISKFPLFDLMIDHLKISWARYHDSIHKHSKEMMKILNFPVHRSTTLIKLPVGSSKESHTKFIVKLPGRSDLSNGALEEVNIGLSPMGRIVLFSDYPAMLNMAVESFKLLLELRGWVGLSQSVIHSRDFKIYLEDPGPFILGANSQLRHLAANISPEIVVVDLDANAIDCRKPHPTALSKGPERAKIEKKIFHYLGNFTGPRSVPPELHEAFPGGRFRPFSAVEIQDQASEAERLLPPPEWNWDQNKTIIVFDNIMSKMPTKGIAKILKRKTYRQAAVLDSSALHVQEIIRKHTISFVNRRDMLETKIWKLNRRLAFLMSESMDWKHHFEQFQSFTDMLSKESQDLKTRLENERREHRTLTGVVAEQLDRQAELEGRLLETEKAWMAAQVELAKAHNIREELQRQKQIMVTEMKSIALAGDDEDLLGTIVPRVESGVGSPGKLGAKNRTSLTTKNLRRLSAQAGYSTEPSTRSPIRNDQNETSEIDIERPPSRPGSSAGQNHFLGADSDEETISDDVSGLSEVMEERALLSRNAVIETMRNIQGRLESALRTAGQLDNEEIKSLSFDGSSGLGRNPMSRLSTDSCDSKVIHLQRGRRKPINSLLLERHSPYTSKSSSSPHNSVQLDQDSGKIDFSCQTETLASCPRSGRASTFSLVLPGSRIFGQRPNSTSPGDSVSVSSITPSTSDGLRSHRLDSVLNEENEEEDEPENDDDDDRATSYDDGASFVSANDDSDSAGYRRSSSDSSVLLASGSAPSSQQDHASNISRVSIIGSTALELRLFDEQHCPSSTPTESNGHQTPASVAFPTTGSRFDPEDSESTDDAQELRSPTVKVNSSVHDGTRSGQVTNSKKLETSAHKDCRIEDYGQTLIGPGKNNTHVNFINHRISNISNSSASTIKIKHYPNLSHHHRHPPLPTALQRQSHLYPKKNTSPELPRSPSANTFISPSLKRSPTLEESLPKHFAALSSSRRLRSPNTSVFHELSPSLDH